MHQLTDLNGGRGGEVAIKTSVEQKKKDFCGKICVLGDIIEAILNWGG